MVGAVGDDDFGRVNTRRLERDGADVSAIHVDPAAADRERLRPLPAGRRARLCLQHVDLAPAARIGWTDAVAALVARAGHLHVMGTILPNPAAWEIIRRAAEVIKARGGCVSLDPNLRKELGADAET